MYDETDDRFYWDLGENFERVWTGKLHDMLRVDVENSESAKKKLQIQKYLDTMRTGLNRYWKTINTKNTNF